MKRSLGPIALSYPLPAYLVGSYDADGRPNIMMAAWGGICNSEPPCMAVSVRKSRWTYAAIETRKAFTISIPSARLAAAADFAGLVSGGTRDKFQAAGLTAVAADTVDAPYVDDCPLVLELALVKTVELGSHVQFIGEIKDVKADEACFGPRNTLDMAAVDPLLYDGSGRQYHRVGEAVAKAWSAGKIFMQ